ncbi:MULTISPECIES: RluA family pseudouridine synthase [Clostridium]|uniref:Pseudouridine synthase n=2 Tax=Clostridium TaxID=1485 RepID=A0A151AQD1_9CLOT|nr:MULTISPECIES: RluA family pseudouridine synthase [Clostridium]KYH29792.1 ribosomal large subunit pseudouridine synthase D [Clostridium colicanis DSM 13634]MBE6044781.1 RluA family pseudouridine synthase [Clostridium thermopalmarium]PRR75173.1 Ribosomal large subunit pseudouridine synthase D [Clostridium thermopalmarium DSM 5974]PVZ27929.1 RluA family pseudouridine synthase [Clostridium thermopalmarium DSM 5974]
MDIEQLIVDEEYVNFRLDVFLSKKYEDKSRSYIQKLIEEEKIKVNDKIKKSNYKLRLNDVITVNIPETQELVVEPENIPLNILYEDEDIIVVNKPQGMVVHPAPGNYNGTLVNALLYHCKDLSGINGVARPGIVHRIDKDTSGILVVAKNDRAHKKLAEQLKEHTMKREYIALLEGRLKSDEGTIDKPIGRNPKDRLKMGVVEGGKKAVTHYKVLERYEKNTLVKCILETGRTHQIRVHMSYIGYPLVGDPIYGFKRSKFSLNGQMLHAKKLGFIHPSSGEYMEFESDLPDYFKEVLRKLS